MAKALHVRVYPGDQSGFDVVARVRGGIQKTGHYLTIEAALAAAWALDRKDPLDPVFVYDRPFGAAVTAFIEQKLAKGGDA